MRIISFLIILVFFSACSTPFFNNLFFDTKTTKQNNLNTKNIKQDNLLAPKKEPTIKVIKQNTKAKKSTYKKIAFIGDSHLASDYISSYFRKSLGIKALGFIPPILPKWHNQYLAKYNNKGFNTEYIINTKDNLSFSGINASCLNSCDINIDLGFVAREIEFLEFELGNWKIKKYAKNTNKINFHTNTTKIGGFLSNNFAYIDNLGINGASIFNYLRINNELAKQIAKKLDYDLVIFSFGTNESVANKINEEVFINNYQKIINLFKNKNTTIILLIPPEPTLYLNKNYVKGENNELVKRLIKKVAKNNNAYIFDIDLLMQKEGGKKVWIAEKKSLKNTHLSKLGYDYVASKLLDFLKDIKEKDER